MKGIDVSKHNGTIDWGRVDASGIDFALVRAGYGNDILQKDPKFEENVQGALAHKLHVGAYWFSYAVSEDDARREAEVCKKALAPYSGKLDFPVAFDYEYASMEHAKKKGANPSNARINGIACAFLDSMRAAGWFVNLYTNLDFIQSGRFSAETLSRYDVWLADYSGGPDYPCGIQQTGSTGTIPGISGSVDIDVALKDYPTIIRSGGYNGYSRQPQIAVVSDTTMDMTLSPGKSYIFKLTASAPPAVTIGTGGILRHELYRQIGSDYLYRLTAIGQPGQVAGIYANGKKIFTVTIK